jgi:hypothetical protein
VEVHGGHGARVRTRDGRTVHASAIVLATPHSDVRQAVGRILRTDGPKVIYDLADTWSVMNAMFRKRAKIYADCGFTMERAQEEEPAPASIFQQGKCLL